MSSYDDRVRLPRTTAVLVALACLLPVALTAWYFYVVPTWPEAVRRPLFLGAKILQFGLPVLWLVLNRLAAAKDQAAIGGVEVRWRRAETRGRSADRAVDDRASMARGLNWPLELPAALAAGTSFGLAVALAIVVGYYWLLAGSEPVCRATQAIGRLLAGYRISGAGSFVMLGVFYSIGHSGLEEYYWQWFVFGQMRRWFPPAAALGFSSIAFMLHHVVLLGYYFGWGTWPQVLFSLAVAAGGAFWAWLYHYGRSLAACWLSHLVVDAALFTVGYWMVSSVLQPR